MRPFTHRLRDVLDLRGAHGKKSNLRLSLAHADLVDGAVCHGHAVFGAIKNRQITAIHGGQQLCSRVIHFLQVGVDVGAIALTDDVGASANPFGIFQGHFPVRANVVALASAPGVPLKARLGLLHRGHADGKRLLVRGQSKNAQRSVGRHGGGWLLILGCNCIIMQMKYQSETPSATDDAVAILRATEDGDLLDPADLRLVQDVVNGGLSSLSPKGLDYWKALVDSTSSGQYVKRWFCGVANLTRDGQGYVHWKGKQVEHYSYDVSRRDEMIESARRLAAICLTVESLGQKVNHLTISNLHSAMDFANAMAIPRFVVRWDFQKEGARLAVQKIEQSDREEAGPVIDDATQAQIQQWNTSRNATRVMHVVTQEDFDNVQVCIKRDCDWARRSFWPAYRNHEVDDALQDAMTGTISRAALITRAQVEQHFIGPALENVTRASEAVLAQDSFEGVRQTTERMTA